MKGAIEGEKIEGIQTITKGIVPICSAFRVFVIFICIRIGLHTSMHIVGYCLLNFMDDWLQMVLFTTRPNV